MFGNQIEAATQAYPDKIAYRPPSLTEQMTERKVRLECELAEVTKVLEGLKANPEAAALFDSISRLGGLRG